MKDMGIVQPGVCHTTRFGELDKSLRSFHGDKEQTNRRTKLRYCNINVINPRDKEREEEEVHWRRTPV